MNENKVKKTKKATPIGPTVMLDSERCILCSRCVRFSDEISKTHEFGIFNRGDHCEIGLYPGMELENNYSGNVVDICPVGALTDRDFRFKCRVWYLKKTDSVCAGCSRGCNITVEANTELQHKAGGARVMRFKPRYNGNVNDWWMCDAGRYGYKFIDHNRITEAVERNGDQVKVNRIDIALSQAALAFQNTLKESKDKIAVLISPQLTNEELYLAKKLFVTELELKRVLAVKTNPDGDQDEFLIRGDKHPNRTGAEWVGFQESDNVTEKFIGDLNAGALKGLIVMGQNLISMFPQHDLRSALRRLDFCLYIGSNHNETAEYARYVLPTATYAEKNGTFTNFEGRVQRIKRAIPPLGDSVPESRIFSTFAKTLGFNWNYASEKEIFSALKRSVRVFQGLSWEKIGSAGSKVRK